MEYYLSICGGFLALSSAFHFLRRDFVTSALEKPKTIRIIGVTLIAIGLAGFVDGSNVSRIIGVLYLGSGLWRSLFPRSSIRFQSSAYPRWVHGIIMAVGAAIIFAFLSVHVRAVIGLK